MVTLRGRTLLLALILIVGTWPSRAQTLGELLGDFGHEDEWVRKRAVQAVAQVGSAALPALSKALRADPWLVKLEAANALTLLGPQAIPTFLEGLGDPSEWVRRLSASGLRELADQIPPNAEPVIPALIVLLGRDDDPGVHRHALAALGRNRADSPAAIGALLRFFDHEHLGVDAEHAFFRLDELALPELTRALQDPAPQSRANAAWAVSSLRRETGSRLVPELVAALSDPVPLVRRKAGYSLGELGRGAAPAIPALARMLRDPDEFAAQVAYESLMELVPQVSKDRTGLWWVVPYAFRWELAALAIALGLWFTMLARFPRRRPRLRSAQLAVLALTAAVPIAAASGFVLYAITREWAPSFLPAAVNLVPIPVAATLTTGFLCALAAVWACQRRPCPS